MLSDNHSVELGGSSSFGSPSSESFGGFHKYRQWLPPLSLSLYTMQLRWTAVEYCHTLSD